MQIQRSRSFCINVFLAGAVCAAASGWATEGYELIGTGPLQKGVAGAGAASGEDASWMILNPAAVATIEPRLDFYLDFIAPTATLEPKGLIGNPFAGEMTFSEITAAPGGGMLWKEGEWTLGLGLYGLGGDSADFESPRSWLALLSNSDRRAEILIAQGAFTVAREFDNGWSVGASLLGTGIRFRTDTLTLNLRPAEADNRWDTAYGAGFNIGVVKEWDRLSIGLSYHSRMYTMGLEQYDDLIVYHLDLPQKIRAGIAIDVTNKLELLLDYKWIDWSDIAQQGKKPIQNGLGWEDQKIYKAGLRYRLNDKWKFRAGYSQGNAPITDENTFINGVFPAYSERHVSAGATYSIKNNLDLHLGISHAFHEELTDSGRGGLFSALGRGTSGTLEVTSVQAGFSYKF